MRHSRFAPLLLTLIAVPSVAQQPRLLVAQKGDATLGIVDPIAGKLIASVPEGGVGVAVKHKIAHSIAEAQLEIRLNCNAFQILIQDVPLQNAVRPIAQQERRKTRISPTVV